MTRLEGPTPAGGAYSEATWFDDQGRELPGPEGAVSAEITEYSAEGEPILRTYAQFDADRSDDRFTSNDELTVEDQDLLKMGTWDLWAVEAGQFHLADTLPRLLQALGVDDEGLRGQRQAVCKLLELPAWVPAPEALKAAVYAWLDDIGPLT